jgi:hypothetical protein
MGLENGTEPLHEGLCPGGAQPIPDLRSSSAHLVPESSLVTPLLRAPWVRSNGGQIAVCDNGLYPEARGEGLDGEPSPAHSNRHSKRPPFGASTQSHVGHRVRQDVDNLGDA